VIDVLHHYCLKAWPRDTLSLLLCSYYSRRYEDSMMEVSGALSHYIMQAQSFTHTVTVVAVRGLRLSVD